MAETVYFDEGNVQVTSTRFITPGETFAMSGVTSVKLRVSGPSYKGCFILGGVGLLLLFSGEGAGVVTGLACIAGAVFWFTKLKSTYIVILKSASGENEAITSKNREFITGIEKALNDSIIGRG